MPTSRYDELIRKSPRDAVEEAWQDVQRSATGVLEGKVTIADRSQSIPVGAMMAMLRNFGIVDQENAHALAQLEGARKLILEGGDVNDRVAREFCSKAAKLVAYFGTK